MEWLLLRNNTLTGQLYRDDPTILAWETGNEQDFQDVGGQQLGLPTRTQVSYLQRTRHISYGSA